MNANTYNIWKYIDLDLLIKPLPFGIPTYQTPFKIAITFPETPTDTLI